MQGRSSVRRRHFVSVPIGILLVLTPLTTPSSLSAADESSYFNPHILVEPAWLEESLEHPSLCLLDFGREFLDYDEAHIPGAVFVDRDWITAEVDGVAEMLAPIERVVAVLEEAGVGDRSTVVVYDEDSGLWASRLLWTLELLGHRDVRLLNGGLGLWVAEGRPVTAEAPAIQPGRLTPAPDLSVIASENWILDHLDSPDVMLLDTRSPEEYTGEDARAVRGGHIPGAVNVEWTRALAGEEVQTVIPPGELRELYGSAGVTPDREIVTYCQGGVRAAHTYFMLRLLGYTRVRNYDGSWAEWGNDDRVPVVTGELPE
jgi:thiosulfate/3-mercaptopyruvate sulfurtransferase